MAAYVGEQVGEDGQRGALAEVDLVRDAGLLDDGPAEVEVLAADVDGHDPAVVGDGERGGEHGAAGEDADLSMVFRAPITLSSSDSSCSSSGGDSMNPLKRASQKPQSHHDQRMCQT